MTQAAHISSGSGGPTIVGKRHIALAMYVRGKAFIGSAILLKRQANSEPMHYVVLHLVCQGTEITLKGLLLLRDYDQYKPRLRGIGHDLCRAASETSTAFGFRNPDGDVAAELKELSNLYSRHLMRYSSVVDILIDPRSVSCSKVLRRIGAAIRIAERELKRDASVI
ncbi:MAG: hypothetical protein ACRD2L_08410 [Terriglobia bacterium]